MLDLVEILCVGLKPVCGVVHGFRKVCLHGSSIVVRGSMGNETRTDGHGGENQNNSAGKNGEPIFGRWSGSERSPGDKGVKGRDEEGKAPDSGDGG